MPNKPASPTFADYMKDGSALAIQQNNHQPSAAAAAGALLPANSDRDTTDYADKKEYRHNGISGNDVHHLKHQQPHDTLDCHGMKSHIAHYELESFLQRALARRLRVVEVIHGIGRHSENNTGILRGKVRYWLSHCPAVLAYCEPPKNSGAVLVLLRQ